MKVLIFWVLLSIVSISPRPTKPIQTVYAWIRCTDEKRAEYMRANISDLKTRKRFYDYLQRHIKSGKRGFLDDVLFDFRNK